jgi:uncharacterized membrane protein
MIILRIAGGIRQHFGMRVTEWIMTAALFGWSTVLAGHPETFDRTQSFEVIAQYGSELTWANICMTVGFIRLFALVVNGTFREFKRSPHLRAGASVVSCVFWGQISLGVFLASFSGGSATDLIGYLTFMMIEMWNLFRAWADVGAMRKAG